MNNRKKIIIGLMIVILLLLIYTVYAHSGYYLTCYKATSLESYKACLRFNYLLNQ